MPAISFIICSWQAPATLDETLHSIFSQDGPAETFEVLVVNNGFSDAREKALRASFPRLRFVAESTPGLAHARRAGFRVARGDFFVCLDDDNVLGDGFVGALNKVILNHPKLGVISPIVVPLWDKVPPQWLQEFGTCCLSYMTATAPPPDAKKEATVWHNPNFVGWPWPPGGGMIIHRSVAEHYLTVVEVRRLKLGRVGNSLGGAEDQDIYCRFIHLGLDAAHSQKLLVFHKIPVSRTRMRYLVRLIFRMNQDWAALQYYWLKEKHPFVTRDLRWRVRELARLPLRWAGRKIPTGLLMLEWTRHAGFFLGWAKETLRSKSP